MEDLAVATQRLLRLFAEKGTRKEYLDSLVEMVADWCGCGSAGIRVLSGNGEIRYESYIGYTREFWEQENCLSVKLDQCVCVRVILGVPEPLDEACMTKGGSFYCRDLTGFVSGLSGDARSRFRGTCVSEGYRNVSIVPIRYRETIVGVIHMADVQAGKLALDAIQFLESLSPLIGEAVHRFNLEEDLRSSEAQYRRIFQNAPYGIFRVSADGDFQSANPALARMFGFQSPEEMVMAGRSTDDSGSDAEMRLDLLRFLGDRDSHQGFSGKLATRTGEEIWISVNAQAVRGEKGEIICYEGTVEDITQRRRAELDRAMLATAVEQASEGVMITDKRGTVRYVNPAFEEITGYGRNELIGTARYFPVETRGESVYSEYRNALKQGEPWRARVKERKKDGTSYEAELTISPIRSDSGAVTGYVTIQRDVTKEVRLEMRIRQSQKLEAVGTLAGGIAHDFSNILSAIIGFSEMALEDLAEDHRAHRPVSQIARAGLRGRELVRQILTFSRQGKTERTLMYVKPAVEESVAFLRASLSPAIDIRMNLDAGAAAILGDPTQFQQVIVNLCTNAAYAMREGGGVLEISLVTTMDPPVPAVRVGNPVSGPWVRLSVSDTGCGMEEDVMERIFDPFFTTKGSGSGTGIGLAVVHGIVESHEGRIFVTSEKGKGTRFDVYFPVCLGGEITDTLD
jgi:PAS domain S-box-containing protein